MFEGESYWIAKILFQKGLASVYLIAFLVAYRQYSGLVGQNGVLPIESFIEDKDFQEVFSIFYFFNSDRFLKFSALSGILLSLIALTGTADIFGNLSYMVVWSLMWFLFLSLKNTGQRFYSSGNSLVEAGFLAIFLVPGISATPLLLVGLFRWFLFRMMFGAGLTKILKEDEKWKDLTALNYFYKIQGSPNPLSKYFHKLPEFTKKSGVLFNHAVLLVVPFFFFAPQPYASIAGALTILHQLLILLSGNFYWLNLLTIVATAFTFSDEILMQLGAPSFTQAVASSSSSGTILVLAGLIGVRSVPAIHSMLTSQNFSSTSYSPLRLVNTYGRYSRVYKEKKEVVIKGYKNGEWQEYEFYGKTSKLERPRFIAPYTHRLDDVLWFVAHKPEENREFTGKILSKLKQGERKVESLFRDIPFDKPPEKIKAQIYRYDFNDKEDGDYWKREKIDEILQVSK